MVNEKKCPFNNNICNSDCALYINPEYLNELLVSRLSSLGVLNRDSGVCSLKTIAMSNARTIFERTTTRKM